MRNVGLGMNLAITQISRDARDILPLCKKACIYQSLYLKGFLESAFSRGGVKFLKVE